MTHYETLGVKSNATPEQIERAWKDWRKTHHPDQASEADRPKATEEFQRRSAASSTLLDPARRAAYDAELAAPASQRSSPITDAAAQLGRRIGGELDKRDQRTGGLGQAIGGELGKAAGSLLSRLFDDG